MFSNIEHTSKTAAVERATNLRNAMNDNLGTLTNISKKNIAEIDAAIAAYTASKDLPVIDRQTKKAGGTDALPAAFTAADTALDNMYSLVRSYFETGNTEMVDEMHLAMSIISTGIRHTAVEITVLADEDGSPVEDATVFDSTENKTYTTNADSVASIASHRSGSFVFVIGAAGRQTVNFSINISRGEHNEFTVRLALAK